MVEEDEEESEIRNQVDFTVSIKKVKDEDKWGVEFKRDKGDVLVFNKIYNDAKGYFGGLVNATR